MKNWSLASKLVAGFVTLLVVLAGAIGAVTVAASHDQAVERLDRLLLAASDRTAALVDPRGSVVLSPGSVVEYLPGQGAGALLLVVKGDTALRSGYVGRDFVPRSLSDSEVEALADIPADGEPRTVALGSTGSYRVVATSIPDVGIVVLNGLSLVEADAATTSLVQTIAAVTLVAVALALILGVVVVQLALRPLTRVVDTATRVSELPLETGEVSMPERAPVDAPGTEVGRVGVALNRLLGKVEYSLAARHASEQKLRRFVADASHELRTPLATIRGYAELASAAPRLPADTARSLERIESEAVRMSTLVEEMLLLARLDAGRDLDSDPVALGALLVEAVADAHVAGPGHVWDLDLPDGDVEVRGDADRLRQAVGNLLANARVHTPPGTTVTATLSRAGEDAVIAVCDDGPGIDPTLQPALFERFSRGDRSRSRGTGSTGLGLAIVTAIVEAHGGRVGVESVPGRTEFRIELPTAPGAQAPTTTES